MTRTSIAALAALPARRRRNAVVLLLNAAVLVMAAADARPARAQQERSDENEQRARELFELGDDHYAAGRYEAAVEHFQRAYELSPQPAMLFNIANAYERMGEYQKAADHLRRYLESPRADDVASVRERIRRLELAARAREIDAQQPDKERPAGASAGASASRPASQPELGVESRAAARPGRSRWLPYSLMAAGGVAIAGGVLSAFLSNQAGDDASRLCNEDGLCTRDAKLELDREKRYALISDIGIGAGVVCAGAGALLLFLSRDDDTPLERASVQVAPSLGTAGLGLEVNGAF
jgi:tetratricopeptide (TPR) repeat protein